MSPIAHGAPDRGRAYRHLERLADGIGVRVAGTASERVGVDYLASVFRETGLSTTIEEFPIPVWHEQRVSLTVDGRPIPAISPCFGGRTGRDGVTGRLVPVGDPLRPGDLDGIDLAGAIAVLDGRNVYWDYPDYWQTDLLQAAGVAGAVFIAGEGQVGGIPQAYYNYKRAAFTPTPPSAIVALEDGRELARNGREATLAVEAEIEWSRSANVVGVLPGTDPAAGSVIVCAHHDSTWTSPGASDNAGGCAIVAELARMFSEGPPPRRTIRFIHWGGHELGLMGSEAWVRANPAEVHRIVAVINFDGQGTVAGTNFASLLGGAGWMELARGAMAATGVPVEVRVSGGGVDSTTFGAVGRNVINLSRWGQTIGNHTPEDNTKSLGPEGLEPGILLSAAILAAAANAEIDPADAPDPAQLQETQAGCARWGWGITG